MREVYDGLFVSTEDIIRIKEKIKKIEWAKRAALRLEEEGKKAFGREFIPMDYSWYVPFENLTESITVENYRNFNGILYYGMAQNLHGAYWMCLNIILLDKHEYLEKVRQTLLYYAGQYPLHYFIMVDSGLVLSMRLLEYMFVADALKQYFSGDELDRIYGFIEGISEDIRTNHEEWKICPVTKHQHCNNHNVWACAALFAYGLFFLRHDLAEYALNDSEGLYVYLEDAITDGGLGIESSIGYNLFAVQALIKAAEAARRSRYTADLYRYKSRRGISIDDILLEIFQMASPDFSIPQLGDCYGHRQKPNDSELYEYAYAAYGRPEYGWILENSDRTTVAALLAGEDIKRTEKIDSISKIYKEHGFISLKSKEGAEYWNSDAWHLGAGFGYNGIHSNCDQLAVTLFGSGRVLIHDHETVSSGRHAFSSDVQRELNRSRLSHSTVIADGRESRPVPFPQTLNACLHRENGAVLSIMDDGGRLYDGIHQKRILCLHENFVADLFVIKSDQTHTYDWILHMYDSDEPYRAEKDDALIANHFKSGDPCYKWIYNPEYCQCGEDIKLRRNIDGAGFRVFIKGEEGTGILRFSLPERDDLKGRMSSSVAVRRTGRNALFACVYSIGTECAVSAEEHGSRLSVTVSYTGDGEEKVHFFDIDLNLPDR